MLFAGLLLLLALSISTSAFPQSRQSYYANSALAKRSGTFNNPILDGGAADPWVIMLGDSYYLLYTTGGDVRVHKSDNFDNFRGDASGTQVWSGVANGQTFTDIWAPELHSLNGQLYIYVAASPPGDASQDPNVRHRMHVLQGTDPNNPQAPFNYIGQLSTPDNNWAIDGTVLANYNGQNYFIWSGWDNPSAQDTQNLYIAAMSSPTQLSGNRVMIRGPNQPWMKSQLNGNTMGVNEGPEIFVNAGRTFLIYSAAGSWTDDYCLAMSGIDNMADPLVASNWWHKEDNPVMSKTSEVFGPGHASFPHDRNGNPYVVYHADATSGAGWNGRTIRTEPFVGFNPDNSPYLPSPHGFEVAIAAPA